MEHLDIGGNGLHAKGASALTPALRQLTTLRRHDLSYNDLCALSASSLAPALQQLTALQHLDLGGLAPESFDTVNQ